MGKPRSPAGDEPLSVSSAERVRALSGCGTWADFYLLVLSTSASGWSEVLDVARTHESQRHAGRARHTDGDLSAALCLWIAHDRSPALLVQALRAGITAGELAAHARGDALLDEEAVGFLAALRRPRSPIND